MDGGEYEAGTIIIRQKTHKGRGVFPVLAVFQNRTFDRAMVFQYKEGIGAEIHIK